MAGSDQDFVSAKPQSGNRVAEHPVRHAHQHRGHNAQHDRHAFHHHVAAAHVAKTALVPLAASVKDALHTAMVKEGVPSSWEPGLQFIMGHESRGQIGVTNTTDSARGLFQLTQASYHLNPSGAQSFGNAVEEAQGGIRYIQNRYQSADNAMAFWRRHGWY